ncbi:TetR/AcrR family transcriptional regulator [Aminobacter niigataensis]|uniref:TetR/AcrR family transcriptional regulator n=1 Tax=Aminobacter niigataensis TaxID=83265 RepID=UPI0024C76D68|nr:TetR/AcrR family transcriptional regulator [Aminobacter niigataensis]CAI2932418.1 TetR family transcriptional regulator [Aminobacter niigataensis]
MNGSASQPANSRTALERRLEQKERLFHAAVCVALENGFGKVTLDAVARQAGISKGGLLHHFSTKGDLIRAMLKHYADAAGDESLREAGGDGLNDVDPLAVAALVAAAEDTALLETINSRFDIRCKGHAGNGQRTTQLALTCGFANRLVLRER